VHLVFLHGPPASGKLTIARELAVLTGFGLFHNHLVVDALTAVFAFGTAPFIRLREQFWGEVFREAAQQDRSVIFTFAPERTVSPAFLPHTLDIVQAAGGQVDFVAVTCPVEELERRIESSGRATFGKLRSRALFQELRQTGALEYPPLPDAGLSIDTSQYPPQEAARRICEFFSLPSQSVEKGPG
jgi:chloramphenicol 3-O-phosphotransferase